MSDVIDYAIKQLKERDQEIDKLKAELERERACVDYYQNDYNHFKDIDMDVDGYGKLARETQRARAT